MNEFQVQTHEAMASTMKGLGPEWALDHSDHSYLTYKPLGIRFLLTRWHNTKEGSLYTDIMIITLTVPADGSLSYRQIVEGVDAVRITWKGMRTDCCIDKKTALGNALAITACLPGAIKAYEIGATIDL